LREISGTVAAASRRRQLPEEVASHVRELIFSGEARHGEFLRMERIAEAVGVSITPVREGLLSLQADGFVRLVPRRGFVVVPFTQQDVRDIFFVQAQLASELAARAAQTVTHEQVARLESLTDAYASALAADEHEALGTLGHAFHREVNLAANSPRLTSLLARYARHLSNRFYASIESHAAAARLEHPPLVAALSDHAPRRARSVMERHILAGGDQLIGVLETRGLWEGAS
jgi:DNA-binding GntR family transcriptional regulator